MTSRTTQVRSVARCTKALGWAWISAACLTLLVGGCGWGPPRELEREYGDVRSRRARKTVDGLDAFAELFRANGYEVRRWRRLSPRLTGREKMTQERDPRKAYDVIVWAPNTLGPLEREQYEFLARWVDEGGTLVLIGRDFDAVSEYWRRTQTQYSDELFRTALQEGMSDRAKHLVELERSLPVVTPLYELRAAGGDPRVTELSGEWADGIDVKETDLRVQVKLIPREKVGAADGGEEAESSDESDDSGDGGAAEGIGGENADVTRWSRYDPKILRDAEAKVLLGSNRGPLVVRFTASERRDDSSGPDEDLSDPAEMDFDFSGVETSAGKVLVITNGSFLLNMGMLARGNRELAQEVVNECSIGDRVAIIRPDFELVAVYDEEPSGRHIPKRHEPLATIIDHISVLGVLACFVVFPIFGRPKVNASPPMSDFAEHIEAVATIMAKSGNAGYARQQIELCKSLMLREERGSKRG